VTLLGDNYVLWRGPEGSLVAAPDRCPHRQAPLSAGSVRDGCLTCVYHGWVFGEEDRIMPERLSGELPLEQTALVSVRADKASVEWRRLSTAMLGA